MTESRLAARHKNALQKLMEQKAEVGDVMIPGMTLMDLNARNQTLQKSESMKQEEEAKSRLNKRRGNHPLSLFKHQFIYLIFGIYVRFLF
jgi:hypothetical protein